MSNTEKNTLVPKLRFAEFECDWDCLLLDKLLTFKNGYNASKDQYGTGKKFINVLDIIENNFITHDVIIGMVEIPAKDYEKNEVVYGDILFQRSSETREEVGQSSAYLDSEKSATFGGFVIRGRPISPFDSRAFNYLLKTARIRKDITSRSGGSTRYNIGQDSLEQVAVNIPTLPEQKKIAAFLTSVDDRIEQLKRKKTLLTSFKKGVMQRLFSNDKCGMMNDECQHDKTTQNPASGTIQHSSLSIHHSLRFRNEKGEPYPDWEEKKLGEISDVRDGTHETPKYVTTGFPLITSKNLSKDGSLIWDNVDYISESDYVDINRRSKVDIGDILFGMIGTIGNPVLVKEDGYAIKNVALIKMLDALSNDYLIQFLSSSFIAKQFHEKNAGGTQKFIALGVIRKLDILVPSLPEQTKIANYLSNIDTKINQVTQQITQTQTFKKGLLQQMFV
jgi:type I restriction enzyme S subunit